MRGELLLCCALLLPGVGYGGSGGGAAHAQDPENENESGSENDKKESASPLATADALREARKEWPKLDRDGRVVLLMRLAAHAGREVLEQSQRWLKEKDPLVRGQIVRLIAACAAADAALRSRVEAALVSHVDGHLTERARREKLEFDGVCALHGRKIPPPSEIEAGVNWKDPWDEARRTLSVEAREERAHMKELIGAIESLGEQALKSSLERIFAEHHDPEVILRVVECWRKRKEWSALAPMADLARIQQFGRAMGGGALIGVEKFDTLRLKWDLHKDRLWWSRPEYLPRASRPICAAASEITAGLIRTARELDGWLLANEAELRAHGVRLAPEFRARAAETQPNK